MSFTFDAILNAQREKIEAAHAQHRAGLEAARLNDDAESTMWHAEQILRLDTEMNALAARANQYVAQQQAQPRGSQYGLSPAEVEIAHNWTSDPKISLEERERTYAEQRQKLRWMRQNGLYSDQVK